MGLTIEFYSAEPQALVSLFSNEAAYALDDANESAFWQDLQKFPMADFSFHVLPPDDLDSLCQILNEHHPLPSMNFENMCVQLWDDGKGVDRLALVAEQFTCALAECSESDIEQVAFAWASTFPYKEPLPSTPAYQAVLQLRKVAHDAITNRRSLIFHLEGVPKFFEYLRYI